MKPKKGMTAQRIVKLLEQREVRYREGARQWDKLGDSQKKAACSQTALFIKALLAEIAELD